MPYMYVLWSLSHYSITISKKKHFERVLLPVRQSEDELQKYFLRMVVPLKDDDENVTVDLINNFCDALRQSFYRQAKEMIQLQIDREQSTCFQQGN